MENRPIGREKRVVSGGSGIQRTGSGLGKEISQRNVRKEVRKDAEKKGGFFGKLFRTR